MKNKKSLIIFVIAILLCLLGTTYAFFNYYMEGANQEIVAGEVTMVLNDGDDTLTLTNMLPETIEEARAEERTDNIFTFTINSTNTTTNKDIYYEIMLNEGDDKSGKTRIDPEHLVFDLIEVNGDTETLLVDAMSYSDLNKQKVWVDKIEFGNTGVSKTYKLRVWLDEDVLISDTDPNADYKASDFANSYASIKVSVYGDFKEKSSPYNYFYGTPAETDDGNISYWPDEIEAQKANITEVKFVSMKTSTMNKKYDAATIKADVTDTTKSDAGSVLTWLENGELVAADDGTETQYYTMYVASEGTTMFPEDCTYMFAMFTGLKNIKFDNINTRNVTMMPGMFAMCSSLTNIDLSEFDTRNVTMVMVMFAYCSNLTALDLSYLNIDKVDSIMGIVGGCTNLTSVNLSGWNVSNITDFSEVFPECPNLTNVNLSNWELGMNSVDIKTLVTGLTNLNLNLSGWDVNKLLMLDGMFSELTNLVSLDLSNWNTKYIISMSNMFYGCSSLTNLNLSGWNTRQVTNMSMMFALCQNLTSLDVSHFNTINVTDMSGMFGMCSALTELNVSKFDTNNVTNMANMFGMCSALEELDLSNFDTNNVTDMSGMFTTCKKIIELDLSSFDTKNVTDMSGMFSTCNSLTSVDLSNFDTSNVTDMEAMFEETSALRELDLSIFDTSNVTNMSGMFTLSGITKLDISNFTFDNLTSNGYMFLGFKTIPIIIVKSEVEQNWILSNDYCPDGWTTENVIVKS